MKGWELIKHLEEGGKLQIVCSNHTLVFNYSCDNERLLDVIHEPERYEIAKEKVKLECHLVGALGTGLMQPFYGAVGRALGDKSFLAPDLDTEVEK